MPGAPGLVKDFFVSYNRADRTWAEWIAWQLEAAGYTVVLQAWDFRPGRNFVVEMQQAVAEAARTIAVLSADYLASRFTAPEWAAAFARDPTGAQALLLPVRVGACAPEGLLPQIVYVDLLGLDEPGARAALLEGVQRGRVKPAAAPAFPGAAAVDPPAPLRPVPRFPGSLPPVWSVPQPRIPTFTGRVDALAQLAEALASGEPAARMPVLTGLGGVGKTQLAVEYAHRHARAYDVVWWVRAEEPATLAGDYAGLATALGLPVEAADQPVAVAAARRWLEQHDRWLLVLDYAPAPGDVRTSLPQGGGGHVLVTSRNPAWAGAARPLPLRPLERTEAVAFLLRRTGQADAAAAGELAAALGDLPLALEQAGAYAEATGRALADYLALFRTRQRELLARGQPADAYPATVATTWELAFRAVEATAPAGADLLRLCAFLAPDDIPRGLLREGAAHLPERLRAAVDDELAWDEAVAALRRFSLMEVSADALAVHRLVQAVVTDRLGAGGRAVAAAAVRVVEAGFPSASKDARTWAACARLLPHALAAAHGTQAQEVEPAATARLLNRVGQYLLRRAEFRAAKSVLERALAVAEEELGPEDPTTAESLDNLGELLHAQGDHADARPYLDRALAITERTLGPEHAATAESLHNLGALLRDQGDLAGARRYLERALAVRETALGPAHPDTAQSLNNLGLLLQEQGDLAGARPYYERALAITEQALGPAHPDSAASMNNLGLLLQRQGDLAGARRSYERALAARETALGPAHPDTAWSLNSLGSVLRAQGDLAGARPYYERALAIRETALGPAHPDTAWSLNSLGALLREQGDPAGSLLYLERALAVRETALGPDHPDTAITLNTLAALLQQQGDLAGARRDYERALAVRETALGPDHPDTALTLNSLGALLLQQEDLAGARPCLERALAVFRLVGDRAREAETLFNFAMLHDAEGKTAEAVGLLEQAVAFDEAIGNPNLKRDRQALKRLRAKLG